MFGLIREDIFAFLFSSKILRDQESSTFPHTLSSLIERCLADCPLVVYIRGSQMFAIIGLGSSYCTGSPSSAVQQEVAGKFGQYVHSAPSADIGVGSFHCSDLNLQQGLCTFLLAVQQCDIQKHRCATFHVFRQERYQQYQTSSSFVPILHQVMLILYQLLLLKTFLSPAVTGDSGQCNMDEKVTIVMGCDDPAK